MKLAPVVVAIAVLVTAGTSLAQNPLPKSSEKKTTSGNSAIRGKTVFGEKCAVCHNANSPVKKIGPGLKGISRRSTFTVNSNKITDESLKAWIENGDTLMPPFKDALTAEQIKDLTAYVKTL